MCFYTAIWLGVTLGRKQELGRFAEMNKQVCVDFDGTLCQWNYPAMGEPMPGARNFLQAIVAMGLTPIVWSSRMSSITYNERERADAVTQIGEWLNSHDMPYGAIDVGNSGKRNCLAYVDDRGVWFDPEKSPWEAVLQQIKLLRKRIEEME